MTFGAYLFTMDVHNEQDQNGLIVSGAVIVWALLIVGILKDSLLFYGSSIGAGLLTIALYHTKKRADFTESSEG